MGEINTRNLLPAMRLTQLNYEHIVREESLKLGDAWGWNLNTTIEEYNEFLWVFPDDGYASLQDYAREKCRGGTILDLMGSALVFDDTYDVAKVIGWAAYSSDQMEEQYSTRRRLNPNREVFVGDIYSPGSMSRFKSRYGRNSIDLIVSRAGKPFLFHPDRRKAFGDADSVSSLESLDRFRAMVLYERLLSMIDLLKPGGRMYSNLPLLDLTEDAYIAELEGAKRQLSRMGIELDYNLNVFALRIIKNRDVNLSPSHIRKSGIPNWLGCIGCKCRFRNCFKPSDAVAVMFSRDGAPSLALSGYRSVRNEETPDGSIESTLYLDIDNHGIPRGAQGKCINYDTGEVNYSDGFVDEP